VHKRLEVNEYLVKANALLGLYTTLPLPILHRVWHKKGGPWWGRILRDGRAIVLQ